MVNKLFFILLLFGGFTALFTIFDLSAKGESHSVRPDGATQTHILGSSDCTTDCLITGSSRLGSNLFHSFSEFNIPENVTVTFAAGDADNIFTRVSNDISFIDGTLAIAADSPANFFLINPHGIVFGPQATLISSGSFVASTADSILFADNSRFSAIANAPSLLTVSAPVGLSFGQQPGTIVNRSQASPSGAVNLVGAPAGLRVNAGQTLALVGGPVLLEGGNLTAGSGQVEIGSVAANSVVSLSSKLKLDYRETLSFEDIHLAQTTFIDTSGDRGQIAIRGRNIFMRDEAGIANVSLGESTAGTIHLFSDESIQINGLGLLFPAYPNSTGNGASLDIVTQRLVINAGSFIAGGTFGVGNGGSITINAAEFVELMGTSSFSPSLITTSTEGAGNGGSLTINTQRLSVTDGAQIQAVTYGSGNGGNLTINATDQVNVSGIGQINSAVNVASGILASSGVAGFAFQPTGRGGNLTINTGTLNVERGAQVAVNSLGSGDAGNLTINAQAVRLDSGSQITAAAAFGNGGNLRLENLETLILRRGSTLSTQAGTGNGQGNGGNISIDAGFVITGLFEDSDIVAKATRGRGGNIEITTFGLYGIEQRRAIAHNGTNDIDASSEFGVSGTTAVNLLVDDNRQSQVELPQQILETAANVTQGCQATGNRFVITGRGGLPSLPTGAVEMTSSLVDLGGDSLGGDSLSLEEVNHSDRTPAENTEDIVSRPTVYLGQNFSAPEPQWTEASGWTTDEKGQIVLTTQLQPDRVRLSAVGHCVG
jgi:filamentous hemagglutinin family protein